MSSDPANGGVLRKAAYGLLTGILFCELFLFAWCRVQCQQTGYDVSAARTQNESLRQDQKELKVQVSALKSPARIVEIGKIKLGLVKPRPEQIEVVRK